MTFREAFENCVESRKMKKVDLAKKLGTIPQILNDWTKRSKGMTVDRMVRIMDVLGYDLVVKDRITGSEITLEAMEEER